VKDTSILINQQEVKMKKKTKKSTKKAGFDEKKERAKRMAKNIKLVKKDLASALKQPSILIVCAAGKKTADGFEMKEQFSFGQQVDPLTVIGILDIAKQKHLDKVTNPISALFDM